MKSGHVVTRYRWSVHRHCAMRDSPRSASAETGPFRPRRPSTRTLCTRRATNASRPESQTGADAGLCRGGSRTQGTPAGVRRHPRADYWAERSARQAPHALPQVRQRRNRPAFLLHFLAACEISPAMPHALSFTVRDADFCPPSFSPEYYLQLCRPPTKRAHATDSYGHRIQRCMARDGFESGSSTCIRPCVPSIQAMVQ